MGSESRYGYNSIMMYSLSSSVEFEINKWSNWVHSRCYMSYCKLEVARVTLRLDRLIPSAHHHYLATVHLQSPEYTYQ